MYITREIADRIKDQSKKRHIVLKVMLSECNLGINAISEFSKGKQLSCISLAKIADYLDCSVDYLLCRTDDSNSHKNLSQSVNTVNGNYNAVDNSSVTVSTSQLDEHQKALLELYSKLSPVQQAQLLVEADKMA